MNSSIENVETTLEPLEYLARSPNRIAVLATIDDDSPTRTELKQTTSVSRVTLSRILSNFEDRDWIVRTNGGYETTPQGSYLAAELTQLLANIEALDQLDDALEWLPTDTFSFELTCLLDATVTTSTWEDHTAQIREVAEIVRHADRITGTASSVSRPVLQAVWEATVKSDATFEGIFDSTARRILAADSELCDRFLEINAAERTDLFLYEGDREPVIMVMVCDETVLLCGHDENGPPPGTLKSTDERVRSWARSYAEEIRAESSPIEAADLGR